MAVCRRSAGSAEDSALNKPSSCLPCPLYSAPGPVFGEGPSRPRLIYIGQNPGADEIGRGPFVGAAGGVLNRQFYDASISRPSVFITNVVKCLTPGNRPPTSREVECCAPLLTAELASHKECDTVVLAGGTATSAFLDHFSTLDPRYDPGEWYYSYKKRKWDRVNRPASVTARMGCVEHKDGRKWIATPHPAAILRDPTHRFDAVEHLKKARLASGVLVPRPAVETDPTDAEVRDAVTYVKQEGHYFADDVETFSTLPEGEEDYIGDDTAVSMCAFAWRPHTAMVLTPRQIHLLAPLYTDPSLWWFEHNGEYDAGYIGRYVDRRTWAARRIDTMLASHFHRSYAYKKLKPDTLSRYTWLPYYDRDVRKSCGEPFYCGLDGVTTYDAGLTLFQVLKSEKLWDGFFRFGMPLLPELEDWRRTGIKVDIRRALLLRLVTEAKIAAAERRITAVVGDPMFNWGSDDQLKRLLYEPPEAGGLGLPVQYEGRGKDRHVTVNFEARKRLRWYVETLKRPKPGQLAARQLLLLVDYVAGEQKKLEYFERISPDGRLHPFNKAHGTESFRIATTPNVQNIPVHGIEKWASHGEDVPDPIVADGGGRSVGSIRSCIVPDEPDHWLLTCDYDQIQLWIMAVTFKVRWLLNIFTAGEYIYGVVYEKLFKEAFWAPGGPRTKAAALPSVDKSKLRRAKAVPLGFLFLRSAGAVAEEYGWTLEEGKFLRDWWFTQCPELERAGTEVSYQVEQRGRIRHCFGDLMWYPSGKVTEAINGYAQNPEARIVEETIIKIAAAYRERGWRERGCRLMLSVHDSLTGNTPPDLVVPAYEEVWKPILERAIPELDGFKFRHSAEVSKRLDWDDDTPKNEPLSYSRWKEIYAAADRNKPQGFDRVKESQYN